MTECRTICFGASKLWTQHVRAPRHRYQMDCSYGIIFSNEHRAPGKYGGVFFFGYGYCCSNFRNHVVQFILFHRCYCCCCCCSIPLSCKCTMLEKTPNHSDCVTNKSIWMFIFSLLLALIFREFYSLPHQLLTQLDEIHGNPRGSHIIAKIFDVPQ